MEDGFRSVTACSSVEALCLAQAPADSTAGSASGPAAAIIATRASTPSPTPAKIATILTMSARPFAGPARYAVETRRYAKISTHRVSVCTVTRNSGSSPATMTAIATCRAHCLASTVWRKSRGSWDRSGNGGQGAPMILRGDFS
jgi:hypothetical protein